MIAVLRLDPVAKRVNASLDHATANVAEVGRDSDRADERPLLDVSPRRRGAAGLQGKCGNPPEIERDGLSDGDADADRRELLRDCGRDAVRRLRLLRRGGQGRALAERNMKQENGEERHRASVNEPTNDDLRS